jgi:hypothetical protein
MSSSSAALAWALHASVAQPQMMNSGQVCVSVERVYVEAPVFVCSSMLRAYSRMLHRYLRIRRCGFQVVTARRARCATLHLAGRQPTVRAHARLLALVKTDCWPA